MTNIMPTRHSYLAFFAGWVRTAALAALVLAGPFLAAQAGGTLAGRIVDASTKLTLGGTKVAVVGTNLETYADTAGQYSLPGVPVGPQRVTFSYVGYDERTEQVVVAAGGNTRLDVAFAGDVVQLERFVIEGSAVGAARAINQQRSAATYTNIVSADEIGHFPDQNAAEALQRLPGVSLYRDQGEGRFIDLRGLNYIYTAVRLNGASVASPELGDRAIALDVLPAGSLSQIEVTKVPTPDMDADGLGGNVNIRTKSPFEHTGVHFSGDVQGIYSKITERLDPKFSATFSHASPAERFGVLVGLSWQDRNYGSKNFEEDGWGLRQAGTGPSLFSPINLGFRDYVINRERLGVNFAFELKPDDATQIYTKVSYNRFTDIEDRHQLYIPFERGTPVSLEASSGVIENVSRVRRDLRIREKDQALRAVTSGFSHTRGKVEWEGQASWSKGVEKRPNELVTRFRRNTADSDLRYVFRGPFDLAITQLDGASITDPSNYTALDRLELQNNSGEETESNFALNAKIALEGVDPAYIKLGASFRSKKKTSDVNVTRFAAPATYTFANLAGSVNPDYPFGPAVPRLSPAAVKAAFFGNPGAFTPTVQAADSALEDWESTEDILAGYVVGGWSRGPARLTGGVRWERTEFDTRGNQFRAALITPTSASRSFDHVLPGAHLRYDFNKRLVGRLSYSQSLTRPAFAESAIFRNVLDNDFEVEAGNPALATLESSNLDASLEYYLPSLGVASVAVFNKEIKNFSYAVSLPNGDPAFPGYDLLTFRNGSDGQIRGVELAYQQQLRFLPAPFDGLAVMGNLTLADSEASYPTRPGENLPFIGQSDLTGNLALTYEKHGLFLRLAVNWRDARLREDEPIGANRDEDRWIDDYYQLDLSTSYRLNRQLEIFAEATNLTNQPFRVFFNSGNGQGPRLVQHEEYDWSANFGVRWKL
jgi:TonB-dependent receptor